MNEHDLATLIDERIRTALDNRAIGSQTENVHKDFRLKVVEKAVANLRTDVTEQLSLVRQEVSALRSDQIDVRTNLTNLAVKIEAQSGHFNTQLEATKTQLEATKNLQTRVTLVGSVLSIILVAISILAALTDII